MSYLMSLVGWGLLHSLPLACALKSRKVREQSHATKYKSPQMAWLNSFWGFLSLQSKGVSHQHSADSVTPNNCSSKPPLVLTAETLCDRSFKHWFQYPNCSHVLCRKYSTFVQSISATVHILTFYTSEAAVLFWCGLFIGHMAFVSL